MYLTPTTDYEEIMCKYMTICEQSERKASKRVLYLHVHFYLWRCVENGQSYLNNICQWSICRNKFTIKK